MPSPWLLVNPGGASPDVLFTQEPRATFVPRGSSGGYTESIACYTRDGERAHIGSTETDIAYVIDLTSILAPASIIASGTATIYQIDPNDGQLNVTSALYRDQSIEGTAITFLLGGTDAEHRAVVENYYLVEYSLALSTGAIISVKCDLIYCPAI
jgi:hypothetical protein